MWFKLYASCVLVYGESCSLLLDLERSDFYEINNEYYEILKLITCVSLEEFQIKTNFSREEIQSFLDKFLDNELGFLTKDPDSFPDIDLTWKSPYQIDNAIIQIKEESDFDVASCINQLDCLGCQRVQLRIEFSIKLVDLKEIVSFFKVKRIKFIEILMPNSKGLNLLELEVVVASEPRLRSFKIYGSEVDGDVETLNPYLAGILRYHKKDIRKEKEEIISPEYFFYNLETYIESQKHNLGLNGKLSIDSKGGIKNYIDHNYTYGNVKDICLEKVVKTELFKEKWFVSNDDVEKCKKCQYRYSCVSNSDIIKKDGKFFKKIECSFDPEKNVWESLV